MGKFIAQHHLGGTAGDVATEEFLVEGAAKKKRKLVCSVSRMRQPNPPNQNVSKIEVLELLESFL